MPSLKSRHRRPPRRAHVAVSRDRRARRSTRKTRRRCSGRRAANRRRCGGRGASAAAGGVHQRRRPRPSRPDRVLAPRPVSQVRLQALQRARPLDLRHRHCSHRRAHCHSAQRRPRCRHPATIASWAGCSTSAHALPSGGAGFRAAQTLVGSTRSTASRRMRRSTSQTQPALRVRALARFATRRLSHWLLLFFRSLYRFSSA